MPVEISGAVKDRAEENLSTLITSIRMRRRAVDDKRLKHHAAWMGERVETNFKSDYFNHTIPESRRSVEKLVTRVSQQLLPTPEFFEVFPFDETGDEMGDAAEGIRAYMYYLVTKRLRIRTFVKQLVRSYLLYTKAISKDGIDVIDQPIRLNGQVTYVKHVWPSARAVDPFSFFTWPETASNVDDAQVVAEDVMMPWATYEEHVASGACVEIERKMLGRPEWPYHLVQRLGYSGITDPSSVDTARQGGDSDSTDLDKPQTKTPPVSFVAMTEIWFRAEGRWKQAWLVWNLPSPTIVRYKNAPKPRPPYRMSVARAIPGQQETTGMMDDLYPLQGLLDDQVNLMLEGQAMAMSGVAAIDGNAVQRANSIVWRPRAKWLVDDPSRSVSFLKPPDVGEAAVRALSVTKGFIEANSGSSPLAEGQTQRGMPRAGFAVSTLVSLSMADIRDIAQTIEEEILTPLLSDLYMSACIFTPDTQIMRIPGGQNMRPQTMTVEDLVGDWHFQWVGSIQSQDQQVRGQKLVSLLGVLSKLGAQINADLGQKNKRINWEAIMKRTWRDGLGERGADSIIVDLTPEEQQAIAQAKQAAAQIPVKASVSFKGEDLPLGAAADILHDGKLDGVSQQMPPAGPPQPANGQTGPTPKAPANAEQAGRQAGRAASESTTGQIMAGRVPGGA